MASKLQKLNALELKYDGPIPRDELRAALKTQQCAWGEARHWMHYYEARLAQILKHTEALKGDNGPVASRELRRFAKKAAFCREQAAKFRAEADALDWQKSKPMAAE